MELSDSRDNGLIQWINPMDLFHYEISLILSQCPGCLRHITRGLYAQNGSLCLRDYVSWRLHFPSALFWVG